MTTIYLEKDGSGVYPASKASAIEWEKIPSRSLLRVHPVAPRSGRQHRMAFALFSYLADALNAGPGATVWDQDSVRRRLLIVTGHADIVPLTDAIAKQWGTQVAVVPRSMNFQAMGGREFGAFLNAAMDYVKKELAPWIEQSDHWPQIDAIINQTL